MPKQKNFRCSRLPLAAVVAVASLCLWAGPLAACPTCGDGVNNTANAVNLRNGYMWSICFMMSMPFLIFGSLGAYLYYEVRKAKRAANHALTGLAEPNSPAPAAATASRG